MSPLITLAIPIYKRLDCLHLALQSVAAQDYPNIELIVSDNGQNGAALRAIVDRWYPKPYVYRENPSTVILPAHHAQLVAAASGRYFTWLPDDDTMSENYVREMVLAMESRPDVSVAIGRQEEVDVAGKVIRRSPDSLPDIIDGPTFVRNWMRNGFASYTPIVARTAQIRDCGGYLDCPWGNHSDDALMLKLCLAGAVAYRKTCAYRLRYDLDSFGWSVRIDRFGADTRRFLEFLDTDHWIQEYAARHPSDWREMKEAVITMAWQGYFDRWLRMERQGPPFFAWLRAGFALPFPLPYYRAVVRRLLVKAIKRT